LDSISNKTTNAFLRIPKEFKSYSLFVKSLQDLVLFLHWLRIKVYLDGEIMSMARFLWLRLEVT